MGLAGAAGLLYLIHHRQLKSKRRAAPQSFLPSLETLDRVNSISLVLGFLLLSLGLVTGVLWTKAQLGEFWTASWHANATALAWLTYASIVAVRFGRPRTARSAAAAHMSMRASACVCSVVTRLSCAEKCAMAVR